MSEDLYHDLGRLERERNLWRALAIGFAAAFALLLALGGVFAVSMHRQAETQRLLEVQAEQEARRQAEVARRQELIAREQAQQAEERLRKAVKRLDRPNR
jgi:hypothetical protein